MKKIFISILALISCVNFLVANPEKKHVTLDDVMKNRTFAQRSVYGLQSMNDGEHYTTVEQGVLKKYEYATGKFVEDLLVFGAVLPSGVYSENYEFSSDEQKILITTKSEYIYRRSFTAEYYIYDVKLKTCKPLSTNGRQQVAQFSPDGEKVAFVRKNNIFIKNLSTETETQITFDGEHNKIINGHGDWVYEEEYELTRAFAWSPDSRKIAYYRSDESEVREYSMTTFENELYPKVVSFKYPKAGEKNSVVSIFVYDFDKQKAVKMNVGDEPDQYIARIKWNGSNLAIIRLNRKQNHLDVLYANVENGSTQTIYSDTEEFYIERVDDKFLTFIAGGKEFLVQNERNGYMHIYRYGIDGKLKNQVTSGNWEVKDFIGCDEAKGIVYYISSESSPLNRELYSVKLNGSDKKLLSTRKGTNRAVFSNGFKYYINFFNDAETPNIVTLHSASGKQLRLLEDNAKLCETLKNFNIAKREYFNFKTSEGVDLNAYIIKPVDFDATKKYPVLMVQYSGPGSQEVLNSFKMDWESVLADKGYIVFCVDGRGTGGRGEAFRKQTYANLGKLEVIDQIESAKYIARQPYVDAQRIGIWGWSYGGFMSLNCILKGADIFKLAIAVAPVTNWRYYDSIYTELYNGLPQENPNGYDQNSPIFFADKLKGKLLIIHGTADDNVHIQNSYEMISKLVGANKQFDVMIYPDKNHSIYGGNTRLQLYTKKLNYIIENL